MLHLSMDEARGVALAAQGLLQAPPPGPGVHDVRHVIERLGAVQIDTISVVERSQYLVLWSRLGAYDPRLLDALLYPEREVFEYWSHAASIVPMADYRYSRPKMLRYGEHMWRGDHAWMERNPDTVRQTLEAVRERGPIASADFERSPAARRSGPWDWHGPKESRRALEVLWTTGDLMVHSRRAGQKVYDLRERVLAEAFGDDVPRDDDLPNADDCLRYFIRRTVRALGVVTPSWLWDYFRLVPPNGQTRGKKVYGAALLDELVQEGALVPAAVDGLREPAFVARERLLDLERLRAGDRPTRTTLLSPFDSLIWDRARTRALFGYEVCFEAYVVPPKRRYGYYCLAILHRGRLVGRLDPKMNRAERHLVVRALHLEPHVAATDELLGGLADALCDLARFLGAAEVTIDRSEPGPVAPALAERLAPLSKAHDLGGCLTGLRRCAPSGAHE
jgi:uncharacterized protein YcaQ